MLSFDFGSLWPFGLLLLVWWLATAFLPLDWPL